VQGEARSRTMGGGGKGSNKGGGSRGSGKGGTAGEKGGGSGGGARQRWAPRESASVPDAGDVPVVAGPTYSRSSLLAVFGAQCAKGGPSEESVVKGLVAAPEEPATPPRKTPGEVSKGAERMMRRLSSETKMDPNAEAFVPAGHAPPTTPGGGKRISLAAAMQEEAPKPASSPKRPSKGTAEAMSPTAAAASYGFGMEQQQAGFGGMSAEMLHYLQTMAMPPPALQHAAAAMYGVTAPPGYTTVMLRNIPNRYTRDMLIDRLDEGYRGQYDFVYLPIDFNSKCNVGYAFINFCAPVMAQRFMQEFHGVRAKQCLPGFSSKKICEVSYATVQGREANMENFRDEKFIEKLKERPEWHPLFFDNGGKEIPLTKVLGASAKKRRSSASTPAPAPPSTPYGAMMSPAGGFSPFGMMPTPFGMVPQSPFGAPPAAAAAAAAAAVGMGGVNLSAVLPNATSSTMLMLKNVPTSFSRAQLIKVFNEKFKGAYDFLYVPGDFMGSNGSASRGFAFINFRTVKRAQQFTKEFDQKKMSECFGVVVNESEDKPCEVQQARLQALQKSIERLQAPAKESKVANSPLEKATEKAGWYPLMFGQDGEPMPFPLLSPHIAGAKASGTPSSRR